MASTILNPGPALSVQLRSTSRHVTNSKARTLVIHRRALPQQTSCQLGSAAELVNASKVKMVQAKDISGSMQSGYKILDIRPEWEFEKGRIAGSLHVPLFVEETGNDPMSLVRKWVVMGYGGLWQGNRHTKENDEFCEQVDVTIPDKATKVLVLCGEGLRSLLAVEKVYEMGYADVAWLQGGLNRVSLEDAPDQEGETQVMFAGIGGVSATIMELTLKAQGQTSKLSK